MNKKAQTKTKVGYVCKRLWESKDWASLELYPNVEALRPDHDGCGIVEVRITLDKVIRDPILDNAK